MKKLILSTTVLITILFLNACSSDDTSDEVSQNSAKDDQNLVEESVKDLMNGLEEFEKGDFSNLLIELFDGVDDDDDFHQNMIEAIEDIPNFQSLTDSEYPNEPFNVQNYFGLYTYNRNLGIWTTASSNSIMQMVFPMLTSSDSNDISMRVSGVTEKLLDIEDPIYIPTSLQLDLSYNNETMFELNILKVDYSMSGEIPVPNNVDFNIYMNPFTHKFNIEKKQDDLFKVSYTFDNKSDFELRLEVLIGLLSTDYENLDENDIDYIKGDFIANSIKVKFDIDYEKLRSIDDPTVVHINNLVDLEVFNNNTLLGEIELDEDADEKRSLHMVFVDGTKTNIENFSGIGNKGEEFSQTLEAIFARYIDRLDD